MRRSFFCRWLPAAPAAITAAALGFGVPAVAAEPNENYAPNQFALLSDTAEAPIAINTDPGVMGEVEWVRERYNDGSIHIERQTTLDRDGNYVNHGSWKMFTPKGDVIAEGHYHFGNRVGPWTRWQSKDDSPLFNELPFREFKAPFMSQVNYTDGVMDGEWTIMDAEERKVSQVSLKEGERHGLAVSWLPNGTIYEQATYENGIPVGETLAFNRKSGKVERVGTYTDGRKVISKVTYHNEAKKIKKSEVMYLGPETSQVSEDQFWTARMAKFGGEGKNLRHGIAKSWYPNGKMEFEGTYQFGKKSGTFTFWHENGQVAATGDYRDDNADGQWVWWHENGQRSAFGRYENGQLVGEWRWWAEDGKLTKQQTYDGTESLTTAEPEEALEVSSRADEALEFGSPDEALEFEVPEETMEISSRTSDTAVE